MIYGMKIYIIVYNQQEPCCDTTKKKSAITIGENKKGSDCLGNVKGGSHVNSLAPPSLYCIEVPYQRQPSDDDGPFVAITWINVLKEVSNPYS